MRIFTVSTAEDGSGGSLRSAIGAANQTPGLDEVRLDINLREGDPTPVLRLTGGPIEITDPVVIRAATFSPQRLIVVADPAGDDIPLDTDGLAPIDPFAGLQLATDLEASRLAGTLGDNHRIFDIAAGAETSISDLTLVGGVTMGDGEAGGAIRSRSDLRLEDVEIISSATFGEDAPGGGVAVIEGASLRVTDGLVAGNATFGEDSDGGGIYQQSIGRPPMTDGAAILETRISGNRTEGALSAGGGLSVGDSLFLISSTVDGNATIGDGASGGGVNAIGGSYRDGEQGSVFVLQSTIADNFTSGAGSDGGGLRSLAPLQLLQSTVTGNSVSGDGSFGGGLSVEDMRIAGSLVLGNFSPRFESEEAFSTNPRSFDDEVFRFGELFLEGFNIIGADDGTFPIDVNRNAYGVTNYLGPFGFGAENADPDSVFAATAEVMLAEPGTTNRTIATGIHAGVLSDSGGALPAVSLSDDVTENPAVDRYRDLGIVLREDDEDLNSNFLTGEILPFRPGLLGLDLSTDNGLSVFGGVADLESDGRGRIDVVEVVRTGVNSRQINRLDDVYFDRLVGHVAARLDIGAVELAVPERAEGVLPGVDLAGLDRALGLPEGTRAALDAGAPSMIGLSSEPIAEFDTRILDAEGNRIDRDFLVLTTGEAAGLFAPDGGPNEGLDRGAPGVTDDTVTLTLEIPRTVRDDALTFDFAYLTDESQVLLGDFLSIRVEGKEAAIDGFGGRFAPSAVNPSLFGGRMPFRREDGLDTGTFLDNRSDLIEVRVPLPAIPLDQVISGDIDPVEVEITLADLNDGVGDSAVLIGDFEFAKRQNVWLDFDGGSIRFDEGSVRGVVTLPPSFTADDRIGLRDNIRQFVRNDYEDYDIGIFLNEPSEPYSTILIGGRESDLPAASFGGARGRAEKIDFDNRDPSDVGFVLAQQVYDNDPGATWRDVAQLASHELGHLLGLRHVTDDHDLLYPFGDPGRRDIGEATQGEIIRDENDEFAGFTTGARVDYDALLARAIGRSDRAVAMADPGPARGTRLAEQAALYLESLLDFGFFEASSERAGIAPLAVGQGITIHDAQAITFIPDAGTFEGTVVVEFLELGDIHPGGAASVPTRSEETDFVAIVGSSTPGGPVDLVVTDGSIAAVPAGFIGGWSQIDAIGIQRAALSDAPLTVSEVAPDGALTPVGTLAASTIEATVGGATEGPDDLHGTEEADTLLGLGGDDTVDGLDGNDRVLGNAGADRLTGGPGMDTLSGGPGADSFADDLAGLDGDLLDDFSSADRILVTDVAPDTLALVLDADAGTLGLDTTGDGVAEAAIRLPVDPRDFVFTTAEEAGGTAITATDAPPAPVVALAARDPSLAEGAGRFVFDVIRTVNTDGPLTLDWAVSGVGVDAADFGGALPSGTLTLPEGGAVASIAVTVSDDANIEPDEPFTVTLSNPSDRAVLAAPSATSTILNDDSTLAIAASDADRSEGDAGEAPFTFTVTRAGDVSTPASVAWSVSGTGAFPAQAGDFAEGALPGGSLAFAPGETARLIELPVAGDTLVEGDDTFAVTLSGAAGATLAAASASGTIRNDDASGAEPARFSGQLRGTADDDLMALGQGAAYLGAAGDDTYLVSPAVVAGEQAQIVDTEGAGLVQLTLGLELAGSVVSGGTLRLVLANDSFVTVLGAPAFEFEIGANATTGASGTRVDFETFVTDTLGIVPDPDGAAFGDPLVIGADRLAADPAAEDLLI